MNVRDRAFFGILASLACVALLLIAMSGCRSDVRIVHIEPDDSEYCPGCDDVVVSESIPVDDD